MTTRTHVYGDCVDSSNSFDLGMLLRQLLLFESVIVRSNRLTEVSALVSAMGADETRTLLDSGALKLEVAASGAGSRSTGELFHYQLITFSGNVKPTRFIGPVVDGLNLKKIEGVKLANAVERSIVPPRQAGFGAQSRAAMSRELAGNTPAIKRATLAETSKVVGTKIRATDLEIKIEEPDAIRCRVQSNLMLLGLSEEVAHKTIERALLKIFGTNYRLEEMQFHKAATSFRDDELPLLDGRFRFLLDDASPAERDDQFLRVLQLRDLPDFGAAAAAGKIDFKQLRRIRQSDECADFRSFLERAPALDDKELKERVDSLSTRLKNAVQSPLGQAIRVAVATLAGATHYGPVPGLAVGVLDYAFNQVVTRSGPAAFLDETLPSIFVEPQ